MGNDCRYPLCTLFWEATLRCNAHCAFCGSRCGDHPAGKLLSEEADTTTICHCLSEIAAAYDPKTVMINVTGGEPLLRRDLFDVMSYASVLGFPWGMVTNGSLIDESVVKEMKRTRMRTVSLSLDGLPKTHNELRKLPDGFECVKTAVQRLKKADFLDEIQITTVVNHQNLGELEPLFKELSTWGLDSWRLAVVDPIGRAEEQKDLLLTKEDYQAYFAFFDAHQFNDSLPVLTSCSHYLGERDNLYRDHCFSCEAGKTVGSILANGDIYVCPNVPHIPELIQGNIKRDSFPEIWENAFQWFRDPDRQKSSKCSGCEYLESCRGDSLHTWDFFSQEPKICYKRNGLGVIGRNPEAERNLKERLLAYYPKMKGLRIAYGNSSDAKLLFTPSASEALLTYFELGETSSRNCFELLAGLVGFASEKLIVVEHIIPGNLEERSETNALFSSEDYQALLKEVSALNKGRNISHEKYKLSDVYSLVGIAHSHPLELSVQLSVPDMALHSRMQRRHGEFVSLLLNPQKKQFAAYYNSAFTPIDMELLVKNEYHMVLSFQNSEMAKQTLPRLSDDAG